MDVIDLPLGQIIPYARNPRRNETAVASVAASIAEFGWRQPIVVDEDMVASPAIPGWRPPASWGSRPRRCTSRRA